VSGEGWGWGSGRAVVELSASPCPPPLPPGDGSALDSAWSDDAADELTAPSWIDADNVDDDVSRLPNNPWPPGPRVEEGATSAAEDRGSDSSSRSVFSILAFM
jgi:hypothetical protein